MSAQAEEQVFQAVTPKGYYLKIVVTPFTHNRWEKFYIMPARGWEHKKVFISPTGESLSDLLYNRTSRPHSWYRKEVLPTLKGVLGMGEEVKFNWSQKAGCTCPCSPGFLVTDNKGFHGKEKYNIYVTVSETPFKAEIFQRPLDVVTMGNIGEDMERLRYCS